MTELYYKVLGRGGVACHGGYGKWLPANRWMPEIKGIVPCARGYHLLAREQVILWLGPEIWTADGRGEHIEQSDKHVFGQARRLKRFRTWNARTQRLFACDCAERVLPIFEETHPGVGHPRECIMVARKFALGQATKKEMAEASSAAAAATASHYSSTSHGASAAGAAYYSSIAYAPVAATEAAYVAAASCSGSTAERVWQTERLFEYLEGTR